jgi:hypothetical protein
VSNSQGTSWLPGPLGGTYYPKGLYYSNGTSWEYIDTPYQATQAEVDAGIVDDKFVTPLTLNLSSQWATKQDVLINPVTGTGANGQVSFWTGTNSQSGDSGLIWDNVNKRFGIGASPASTVRLDVRAQGVLSTDIAFRVRNSLDTRDFLVVNGAGDVFNNGVGGVSSNTFFGENSGRNATGDNDTFFGRFAGNATTTGTQNTFVGASAGRDNTNQGSNSYFGAFAGLNNNGAGNTFLGRDSGRRFGGGAGSNLTSISNSVFIGFDARASANNQTNQIVVGASAIGLGSNTTVIGNSSTTLFRPFGNVAIGADTAGATLDVRAQGALSTDTAFRVRNSTDSNNILSVQGNGVLQHTSLPSTTVSTTTNVYSFPTTLGKTFKMMYNVESGSDIRGGEYICVHNGTNINTIHTFPTEFGDTSGINFTFSISGGNIVVTANVTTGTWAVKLNIQIL